MKILFSLKCCTWQNFQPRILHLIDLFTRLRSLRRKVLPCVKASKYYFRYSKRNSLFWICWAAQLDRTKNKEPILRIIFIWAVVFLVKFSLVNLEVSYYLQYWSILKMACTFSTKIRRRYSKWIRFETVFFLSNHKLYNPHLGYSSLCYWPLAEYVSLPPPPQKETSPVVAEPPHSRQPYAAATLWQIQLCTSAGASQRRA